MGTANPANPTPKPGGTPGQRRAGVPHGGGVVPPVDRKRGLLVRGTIERMLPEAEKHLDEPLLDSFRAFCRLWYGRYDWENANALRYYLVLSIKERREIFKRFLRESRSWEDSLRIVASGEPLDPAAGQSPNATAYWREQRRRRARSLDERATRTHDFYERLAKEADTYTHTLRLPWIVREAFHTLGLPAGTPVVEVRSTFRRLAFRHHPDRTGDNAVMSELNRAYRVLMKFFGNR